MAEKSNNSPSLLRLGMHILRGLLLAAAVGCVWLIFTYPSEGTPPTLQTLDNDLLVDYRESMKERLGDVFEPNGTVRKSATVAELETGLSHLDGLGRQSRLYDFRCSVEFALVGKYLSVSRYAEAESLATAILDRDGRDLDNHLLHAQVLASVPGREAAAEAALQRLETEFYNLEKVAAFVAQMRAYLESLGRRGLTQNPSGG